MDSLAPSARVAMCIPGSSTSTSEEPEMEPAVTWHSPSAAIFTRTGSSQYSLAVRPLMLRMISVTSSLTPGMVENSCWIPSIFTEDTATPGSEESSTLLRLLPKVMPKPRSRGSATNLP